MAIVPPTVEELPPIRRHQFSGGPGRPSVWPASLASVEALAATAPGEWVRVAAYATAVCANRSASRIRREYDPDGRFEFASRTVDGKGVLYARLRTESDK